MSGETGYPMEHRSERLGRAEVPRLGRAERELHRAPRELFAGMGRERASRMGAALVERAAETGEWFPLVEALAELRGIVRRIDDLAASDYAPGRPDRLGDGGRGPEYMGR